MLGEFRSPNRKYTYSLYWIHYIPFHRGYTFDQLHEFSVDVSKKAATLKEQNRTALNKADNNTGSV